MKPHRVRSMFAFAILVGLGPSAFADDTSAAPSADDTAAEPGVDDASADRGAGDSADGPAADGAITEPFRERRSFGALRMRDHRSRDHLVVARVGLLSVTSWGAYWLQPEVVYHHSFSDRLSLGVGTSLHIARDSLASEYVALSDGTAERVRGTRTWRGAGPLVELHWHPVGNGFHGPYLGPRFTLLVSRVTFEPVSSSTDPEALWRWSMFESAATFGWRWVFRPGFSYSLGAMLGYAFESNAPLSGYDGVRTTDAYPTWAFTMHFGWAF